MGASCKSRIVLHNKAKTDEKAEFIGNSSSELDTQARMFESDPKPKRVFAEYTENHGRKLVPRSSLFCGFSEAKSVQMQGAQGQT
uniref:Uncharacterized protein n=1 Tax=Candidatus Kentrum sp. DK TaxID=2126562 RepID=A0A450SRC0_9GAMM|nr:MAG: hypothetical protein BECKDK2373C_GA0170839_10541 [Candidatus Kentron sp. DK]